MATIKVTAPPDDDPAHPRSSTTSPDSASPLRGHLAPPAPAADETHKRSRTSSTATQPETTILNPDHPPPLDFHFAWKGPILYLAFLLVCNVLIPCVSVSHWLSRYRLLTTLVSTAQLLYYLLRICPSSLLPLRTALLNLTKPLLVHTDTRLDDKELIGIGSAALGVSSCFDAPVRLWKRAFSSATPRSDRD